MTAAAEPTEFLHTDERDRIAARLARVEGQLRGIQRLIHEGKDCEKVLQQMAAARGALQGAFHEIIACAFETQLAEARGDAAVRDRLDGLTALLKKYA